MSIYFSSPLYTAIELINFCMQVFIADYFFKSKLADDFSYADIQVVYYIEVVSVDTIHLFLCLEIIFWFFSLNSYLAVYLPALLSVLFK